MAKFPDGRPDQSTVCVCVAIMASPAESESRLPLNRIRYLFHVVFTLLKHYCFFILPPFRIAAEEVIMVKWPPARKVACLKRSREGPPKAQPGPLCQLPLVRYMNIFQKSFILPSHLNTHRKEYVMATSRMANVLTLVLTLTIGITSPLLATAGEIHPLPSIITDIDHHIAELTINIEKISDRMKWLREVPASQDPLIQEVRNLDLRGWEVHQEQWKLQLDGLRFTEGLLRKIQDHPEEKSEALQAWLSRLKEFKAAMKEFRQQRAGIEELRIETEAKLIEQYLR